MDQQLRDLVHRIAASRGIQSVSLSFEQRIDQYMRRPDIVSRSGSERRSIQAFLCSAALRIARQDGKTILESDDAKAAIWYFHKPTDENDACVKAAEHILEIETQRRVEVLPGRRPYGVQVPRQFDLEPDLRSWVSEGSESSGHSGLLAR